MREEYRRKSDLSDAQSELLEESVLGQEDQVQRDVMSSRLRNEKEGQKVLEKS